MNSQCYFNRVLSISSSLIIDDDQDTRKYLVEILKEEGVQRICDVPSAEQALEVLKSEPFSIIIADYHLKGMNGVAFMGRIRLRGDQTPVLLITGVPDKTEVIQAAASHLRTAFLSKPFNVADFVSAIERLVD